MSLTMKDTCERCGSTLAADGEAYVCSYKCTFCPPAAAVSAAFPPSLRTVNAPFSTPPSTKSPWDATPGPP